MSLDGFVIVAGVPGSGKTTLAHALAPELGLPLFSKDTIKEALFDALGTGELAWSQQLGGASHRVMYALAADAGAAVLESHFHRGVAESDLHQLGRKMLQVYCRCPIEVAVGRYLRRATSPDRHPGHRPEHQSEAVIAGWRDREPQPLELDAPLIEVSTLTPVDTAALARADQTAVALRATLTPFASMRFELSAHRAENSNLTRRIAPDRDAPACGVPRERGQAGRMDIRELGRGDEDHVIAASHLFDGPANEAATQRFLADEDHHLLIAYEDDEAAGFVSGVKVTHPDKGTEMFLYELGVDERFRRRGLGQALVERLAELARQRGCYGMWVVTDQDNVAALATYQASHPTAEDGQVVLTWTF